jgi:hypothetical protein
VPAITIASAKVISDWECFKIQNPPPPFGKGEFGGDLKSAIGTNLGQIIERVCCNKK